MTLEIPADLEIALKNFAVAQGLEPSKAGLAAIRQWVSEHGESTPVTESALLEIINRGFPGEWWNRYKTLVSLRQADEISERDMEELITCTETLEACGAARLKALANLSALRGTTVETLMEELEIYPVALAS